MGRLGADGRMPSPGLRDPVIVRAIRGLIHDPPARRRFHGRIRAPVPRRACTGSHSGSVLYLPGARHSTEGEP